MCNLQLNAWNIHGAAGQEKCRKTKSLGAWLTEQSENSSRVGRGVAESRGERAGTVSRAWHCTNILTEQFPHMNCVCCSLCECVCVCERVFFCASVCVCVQVASAIGKCSNSSKQITKVAAKLRQKCGKMKWSNGPGHKKVLLASAAYRITSHCIALKPSICFRIPRTT